jgi:ribosomal-protein-alanine N-acetyltransferase
VRDIPTLRTDRLLLLPPGEQAGDLYHRFYTDESASRAYGGPLSAGAAWSRLAADLGSWHLQGFGVWLVQRRQEGDLVGTCGFWQGKGWPRELTWWLLPEARGAGLALEASRAAIAHAYRVFRWQAVETYMKDANAPARALVQRLGGVFTARRTFPDGLERDMYRLPDPAEFPTMLMPGHTGLAENRPSLITGEAQDAQLAERHAQPQGKPMLHHPLEVWHRLVRSQDSSGLDALLAEEAVFHSPVVHSPQRGRKLAAGYLAAAFRVFFNPSFHYVREIVGASDAMLEFETQIDDVLVNGVDIIKWNEAGQIVEFKVMLRPLKAINLIHQRMAAMLQSGQ